MLLTDISLCFECDADLTYFRLWQRLDNCRRHSDINSHKLPLYDDEIVLEFHDVCNINSVISCECILKLAKKKKCPIYMRAIYKTTYLARWSTCVRENSLSNTFPILIKKNFQITFILLLLLPLIIAQSHMPTLWKMILQIVNLNGFDNRSFS